MTRRLVILASVGSLAGVALAGYAADRLYFAPAAGLRAKLADDRAVIRRIEDALKDRGRPAATLKAVAATTLGSTEEQVDAALRERLNAIGASSGLSGVQVETSRPDPEATPAGRARIRGEMGRELRRRTDFWVVRGSLLGRGTLEQALRALAAVQDQPWAHRVESLSIKPEGKERDRFEFRVGVATMMLPDLLAPSFVAPAAAMVSETNVFALGPIVAKNVFRPPPADQAPPRAAPPPGSPYMDWKLTGIVDARSGAEAWLHNTRSNERVTLSPGGSVLDLRLVAASGERAVFEAGGKRFEVLNGQTLAQRRPAD